MSALEFHGLALAPGAELHRYRLLEVLGVGGFGITYLAEHVSLGHRVAVKEYLPNELAIRDGTSVQPKSSTDRPDFEWGLARFLDEAKTLARFEHRNLVRVRDFFEDNRTAYMVMDYEEGEPLSAVLDRRGRLPEDELLRLLSPLVAGLAEVHEAGFLHRDVKPSNVYVRKSDGSPVLLDFGSARQALGRKSRSLTAVASAGYAPPEQYETNGEQGPWTDVYALSALCYRAIAGEAPTEAPRRMNRLVQDRPDPLRKLAEESPEGYSPGLLAAVDGGLALAASKRPASLGHWAGLWSRRDETAPAATPLDDEAAMTPPEPPVLLPAAEVSARAVCQTSPTAGSDNWFVVIGLVLVAFVVVLSSAVSGCWSRQDGWRSSVTDLQQTLGRPPDPAAVDSHGRTDLHRAAEIDDAEAAAWLLANGAEVDAQWDDGRTPLHFAAWADALTVAEFLLANGADIEARDSGGWTPLHFAGLYDSVAVAEFLLANGAGIEARDSVGLTSLHFAALSDSVAVAEFLLASGADIEARDSDGGTPLHTTGFYDALTVAEFLLANGADIDARDSDGWTPLHVTAGLDSVAVAEFLLANGADVDARKSGGETPLDVAIEFRSDSVARLLRAGRDRTP